MIVSDTLLKTYEDVAIEGLKAMKEFLVYRGEKPQYYHRAKIGATAAANLVRLHATIANRMAIDLAASRGLALPEPPKTEPKV